VLQYSGPLRQTLRKLLRTPVYRYSMLVMIISSCVFLALVRLPRYPRVRIVFADVVVVAVQETKIEHPVWAGIFGVTDLLFVAVFGVEFLLKALAIGFIFPKHAYLRDSWNCVDLFVWLVRLRV
jgi:hypothetical protein